MICLFFINIHVQAQWEELNIDVNKDLFCITCLNKDTLFVCGESGTIIKTIDGGITWKEQQSGTMFDLYTIKFANDKIGYAGGGQWVYDEDKQQFTSNGTVLLKTVDGGETWSELQITIDSLCAILDIYLIDKDTLYFLQEFSGDLIKSTDGGNTWNKNLSVDGYLTNFYFNEEVGYVIGHGNIYKTLNYGESWDLINTFSYCSDYFFDLNGTTFDYVLPNSILTFKNKINGERFSSDRIITKDGFNTYEQDTINWFYNEDIPCGHYAKVSYLSNGKGCAVAGFQIFSTTSPSITDIMITRDTGNSWYKHTLGIDIDIIFDVKGIGDSTFYIAGRHKLYKSITLSNEINAYHLITETEIFPNPTTREVQINNNQLFINSIFIYDMMGKKIIDKPSVNNYQTTIDLSNLNQGIYFIKISTDEGSTISKVIKQ